jgi:hypothetical protein
MGLIKKSGAQELFDAYKAAKEAKKRELENERKERERLAREYELAQEQERKKEIAARRKLRADIKKQITNAVATAFHGNNSILAISDDRNFLSAFEMRGFSIRTYNEELISAEREATRIYTKTIESRHPIITNQLNNIKYELEIELAKKTGKSEAWARENIVSPLFQRLDRQIFEPECSELNELLKRWVTLPSNRYVEATRIFSGFPGLKPLDQITFNESFVTRLSYHALLLRRAIESINQAFDSFEKCKVNHQTLLSEEDRNVCDPNDDFLISWRDPNNCEDNEKIDARFLHWIASPAGQNFSHKFNECVDNASKAQERQFTLDTSALETFENYQPSLNQLQKALKLMDYDAEIYDSALSLSF